MKDGKAIDITRVIKWNNNIQNIQRKKVIFDRDTNIIISVKNLAEVKQILPWRMLNLKVRYWDATTYDGITIILDCVVKIEK